MEILDFIMRHQNGQYNDEYDYLSKEEKDDIDFIDECIYSSNKKIADASFYVMTLIMKVIENADYSKEMVELELDRIKENLNSYEKTIIDKFIHASINTVGVLSDDALEAKKLMKERKN